MKVLFLASNFPPEVNAFANRAYEHSLEWVNSGADVTVVTCAPNFPQGRVREGYKNNIHHTETVDGIEVVRVWTFIAPNTGFLKRVLVQLSYMPGAFIAGLFQKTDVILASSPNFFSGVIAYALSRLKRRPWVFEIRDIFPESIVAVGAMKKSPVIRALEKLELFLYRTADRVIVVTPAFKHNIARRGIDADKIDVVPNGVNRARFQTLEKDRALLDALSLDGKLVIGYLGTHGMAHGLDFIVRCAAKITADRLHFLFIGDGAEKPSVVALAASLGLKNVTFLDPVGRDSVARYLSLFDIALVPLRRLDTFKEVIPSKIFEAGAMGKPILLGVEGQAKEIIEEYDAGLCFEPENEASFLAALDRFANEPALVAQLKAGCERLAHSYDRKVLAARALAILGSVVGNGAEAPSNVSRGLS